MIRDELSQYQLEATLSAYQITFAAGGLAYLALMRIYVVRLLLLQTLN